MATITEKLHDAAAIQRRAKGFRTLLLHDNSPVLKTPASSSADMTDLVTLWNQSLGSANSSHAGYMAKVAAAGKTASQLLWAQATRISMALARMRCLPGPEAAKEDRTALLLIQRLMLGFEIGPDWRGDDALERLHDWFQNEAPGPITSTALFEEAYSDGGRKPRAGADLTELRFKAESDNWCKAKDKFNGLVSSVQLSAGDNAEDTGLVESLSERGVADLSVAELGALLEAKQRLAAVDASVRGKKLGLFEPVELGAPEETSKELAVVALKDVALEPSPSENSMLAILKQMQGDNTDAAGYSSAQEWWWCAYGRPTRWTGG